MKDVRYTKKYTLRKLLKELKQRKIYANFLIGVSVFYTSSEEKPYESKDKYVKEFIKTIDILGETYTFGMVKEWRRIQKWNKNILI